MSEPGRPMVVAVDEQTDVAIDLERWRTLAEASLRACDVERGELNLLFVDEVAMAELNRVHMGKDGPTDVLSFPLDEPDTDDPGGVLLGDVVVCPTRAAEQAADHGGHGGHDGSLDDELALLIVHGVLHVLGHDHARPSETRAMQAREQQLLAAHHRR